MSITTTGGAGNDWFSNPIKQVWDGGLVANDQYAWNYSDGTLTTYTDRRGWNTGFTYDARGNMLTKTDREGWLWRWIYYQDKVVTQIDPTLNRTIYAYYTPSWDLAHTTVDPTSDPFDGTYSKPSGVALKTNYTYNAAGEPTSQWTGTDTPVQYSNFDAYGNARTVTDPNGQNTTFTFDDLNNKLTQTLPSPQGTTSFAYDNWNRPTRVTHPGGAYVETTYDNNGNKLTVRDENAFITQMSYNPWNWLGGVRTPVDATPANDIVVEYFYDADGHRIQIENGRDKSTYYDRNARGEVWRTRYPDSTNRQFTFDGNGNILTRTDGKGQVTTFVYDKEDRLTQRKYGATIDFTNTWRSDGLLSQRVDPTGTYTWGYNGAKQLTSAFQPLSNKTVTYTYDTGGRRKTTVLGSMTWTNNYGSDTRLTNIQQTIGASTAVAQTYNPDGSLLTRTFGANAQILRPGYDTRGRTTSLSYRSISGGTETERQRVEYTYDDVGNILTYRNNGSGGGGNNWLTTYTYDRANRLKTEIRTGGAAHNFNLAYNYDKSNNRTSVVRNGSSSTYTVDDNDKFLTGDGFTASSYDNDGNPGTLNWPGRGNYVFTYNREQKPTSIVAGSLGTWTHTYDGEGRRVKLVSPSGERRYVFDGVTVIAETDSSGTILTYHVPDVGWIEGGTQRFYRQNGLGSNLSVLDTSGTKVSESEFDGYGNEYTVQAGPQNQFGFAGKHGYQMDSNDLQLLGARFYVAPLGRFLTQDPIGQAGGLNLYAYCENNPLTHVDADGEQGNRVTDYLNRLFGPPSWSSVKAGAKGALQRLEPSRTMKRAAVGSAHMILEVAALFDPTPSADSLHALLYSAEGDNATAGMYVIGAMIPFGTGGMVHGTASMGKWVIHSWDNATFPNVTQTLHKHWLKHGKQHGVSMAQYTADANAFWKNYNHLAQPWPLRNGTTGKKIKVGKSFGIYTNQGKIVTFGYK